jgi:hypothetical protein
VQACQVCGRSFDPLGFQVVIPELGRGYDRVACAQSARALASPASKVAPAPLAAVVEPIGLAAAAAPAAAWRPNAVPAATVGLLAAGTAAAAFLWLRALATDPAGFPLIRGDAPAAAAGETVEAQLPQQAEPTAAREAPANPRADNPTPVAVVANPPGGGTAAPPQTEEAPPLARRPSSDGDRSDGDGTAKEDGGKGKAGDQRGNGKGLGHVKHGDTNASHTPGHSGNAGSASSHSSAGGGSSNANAHANGKAKGKKH